MEKYVTQIVEFIRNNKEFEFKEVDYSYNFSAGQTISLSIDSSRNLTYNNMGATILDAVLQAGVNYKSVVRPRVDKFREEFKNKTTTSDFYKLIQEKDLSELINFKGDKIDRIITLAKFLKTEKIETEDDLYIWLSKSENLLLLSNLKGIKDKTINYLKILTGYKDTVAVDIHLLNFIKQCCNLKEVSKEFAHELLLKVAKETKIDPATLDYSIWSYMSK